MRSSSDTRFWLGFLAGWLVYFGINVSFVLMESEPLGRGIVLALLNTVPPMSLSAVVAANRHRLLQPQWSVWRVVGVQLVVGTVFAVSSALLLFGLIEVFGIDVPEFGAMPFGERVFRISIASGFLYIVFAGLMMWAESATRMRESHALAAREAVLRAEVEAKAVRAQFNPHFVFNTLHSLMLLVRADPAAAERAIEDVATLIRYASVVQRRDLDAVPLSKEVEVARRYVALEQLRLEDRLTVTWAIELDAARVSIPAFALQTLVENAVRHGIEPSEAGGSVRIRVVEASGRLEVAVHDDGVGAPSTLEARDGHGLGLLRRRLANRYGGDASLSWESKPGEGFRALLRLPIETAPDGASLAVIEERETARAGAVGGR